MRYHTNRQEPTSTGLSDNNAGRGTDAGGRSLRELRRDRAPLVWLSAVIPLGYFEAMCALVPGRLNAPAMLVTIPALIIVVSLGLWFGHNWARLAAGGLALAFAIMHATFAVQALWAGITVGRVVVFFGLLGFASGGGIMAWIALQPGTKEQFARARKK